VPPAPPVVINRVPSNVFYPNKWVEIGGKNTMTTLKCALNQYAMEPLGELVRGKKNRPSSNQQCCSLLHAMGRG